MTKGKGERACLLRVEISFLVAGHVLRQGHGLVADGYGVLDDVLELVLGVAGAELARVGVHREGHGCDEVVATWGDETSCRMGANVNG